MWKTLFLILPILIPSWRFFKTIEPSPRIQWARVGAGDAWHDCAGTPATTTPLRLLTSLFWNPQRNADLFMVSCAERIQQEPTAHSIDAIKRRVRREALQAGAVPREALRFRLLFVRRIEDQIVREVVFTSDVFAANAPAPA